jgi:hypothetical protein
MALLFISSIIRGCFLNLSNFRLCFAEFLSTYEKAGWYEKVLPVTGELSDAGAIIDVQGCLAHNALKDVLLISCCNEWMGKGALGLLLHSVGGMLGCAYPIAIEAFRGCMIVRWVCLLG